ncbi:MAG: hypothetical protein ABIK31_06160 [candidate division WOR-3 bacterium]
MSWLLIIISLQISLNYDNILSVAESLYSSKDYYNAATEYERYLFFVTSNDSTRDLINLKLAQCYLNVNDVSKGKLIIENIINKQSIFSYQAQICLAKYYFSQHDYFRARIELNDLSYRIDNEIDKRIVYKMLGLIALYEKDINNAIFYLNLAQDTVWIEKVKLIQQLPKKNVLFAMGLSTIIPGLGEMYVGKYKLGLWAFLVNSATVYGTIRCFQKKQYLDAALLFSLLFMRFYNGSRNNAQVYGNEYNDILYQQKIKELQIDFSLK